MTEAEYLAIERAAEFKSEFFSGEMFARPGSTAMHCLIATNLIGELGNKLKGRPCHVFTSDLRVKIEATGLFTYPDVSVACEPFQLLDGMNDTILNPVLLVEVLSDFTEAYDRGEKFQMYRQIPSFKEYVLASQRLPRLEHFRRSSKDEWTLRTVEGRDASLTLPCLELTIELNEVFAGVEFEPTPLRPQIPNRSNPA